MSNHKIDPSTGMPAVPDGWRWRVEYIRDFSGAIRRSLGLWVALERHSTVQTSVCDSKGFLGIGRRSHVETSELWGHIWSLPVPEQSSDDVVDTARQILDQLNDQLAADSLVGTYPPGDLKRQRAHQIDWGKGPCS
ncbi:Uncharacterised protein [Acidipropionibacterium jensenii]|uniref:Uncharacterized protein n=1 Tax=Acidipropionibacterium jensenii TaxID=1749 RepID=A0A448P1Q8_9ACTN|nr:hypothetical protein [Acidipropionibacterium jensenii]VEI04120.1 Uncharacterised protein [Acidipropionibacterium jensenii]